MSSKTEPQARVLSFGTIASHYNLRCDAKYRLFWGIRGDNLYPASLVPCQAISTATLPYRTRKLKKGLLSTEYEIVELEDVEKRTGTVLSTTTTVELQSEKLVFGDADVLTTRLRPYLGKTILNDKTRLFAGTTEWIPLKVDRSRVHPKLLKYFLLAPAYVNHSERLLSGKEHPRIAESDILSLKVPFFDEAAQARLLTKIEKLEREIERFRTSLRAEEDVINDILCAKFKYPLKVHKARVRAQSYRKPLSAITDSFTLRSSARFNHPDFELTENFFRSTAHTRVKAWISCPIRLGATAKKGDFVPDGEAYYVHPGATKHQGIIYLEDCHQVSSEFFEANGKAALRPEDILINRSGEALGKVALFNAKVDAVASDFTMRVRLNDRVAPHFVWYFFRSVMFQAQIARELRGSSIQNIFPPQVQQMFVVDCSVKEQIALAKQIDDEIDIIRKARERVKAMQSDIHSLIDAASQRRDLPVEL